MQSVLKLWFSSTERFISWRGPDLFFNGMQERSMHDWSGNGLIDESSRQISLS